MVGAVVNQIQSEEARVESLGVHHPPLLDGTKKSNRPIGGYVAHRHDRAGGADRKARERQVIFAAQETGFELIPENYRCALAAQRAARRKIGR